MTRPSWLGRAARNRHRDAIEQASRRWLGGRRDDSARTRRKILISTQVNETYDRYMSCHMLIKIPSSFEAWTLTWLMVISMFIGMVTVTYFYIRRKMKRKYLLAKIERRRSRRSSEESARNSQQADAFKVT